MADNYTSFSCVIDIPPEHRALVTRLLQGDETTFEKIQWSDDESEDPGFAWEWSSLQGRGPEQLWINSDESGNVEDVCIFVSYIQRRLDLEEPFEITWANTCSKLRVGEFGGGACIIYKGKQRWVNTGSWCDRTKKQMIEAEARRIAREANK